MKASSRFLRRLFVAVALALIAAPASAADLDSYRAQGVIAERFDGYVELKDSAGPADAKAVVDQVNAKRSDIYKERSASQKVPIEDVAKIYAGQIFNEAPSGTYFRKADGSYVKK